MDAVNALTEAESIISELSANDLANAWDYVGLNKTEIEDAIFANEAEV